MCWSETTSYVSFVVGSVLNALTFAYLRRVRPAVAPIALYWEFCLLMQLPEGAAWRAVSTGGDLRPASLAAMWLNVLQPVVLATLVTTAMRGRLWGVSAVVVYAAGIVAEMQHMWPETIEPADGCHHLDLAYWNGTRSTLYFVSSLCAFAAIPSAYWALVNGGFFLITFALMAVLYPCGQGSLWCWIIFIAGPVLCAAALVERSMIRCFIVESSTQAARRSSSARATATGTAVVFGSLGRQVRVSRPRRR